MNEKDFWRLFRETGRPEYYVMYRQARNSPPRSKKEKTGRTPRPG